MNSAKVRDKIVRHINETDDDLDEIFSWWESSVEEISYEHEYDDHGNGTVTTVHKVQTGDTDPAYFRVYLYVETLDRNADPVIPVEKRIIEWKSLAG